MIKHNEHCCKWRDQNPSIFQFLFLISRRYSQRKPLSTTDRPAHVRERVSEINRFNCRVLIVLFIFSNAFHSLQETLWTMNQKIQFPGFSLTLTVSKIFLDFLKNSHWTFPDLGKIKLFFFPDFSLTKATPNFYPQTLFFLDQDLIKRASQGEMF